MNGKIEDIYVRNREPGKQTEISVVTLQNEITSVTEEDVNRREYIPWNFKCTVLTGPLRPNRGIQFQESNQCELFNEYGIFYRQCSRSLTLDPKKTPSNKIGQYVVSSQFRLSSSLSLGCLQPFCLLFICNDNVESPTKTKTNEQKTLI